MMIVNKIHDDIRIIQSALRAKNCGFKQIHYDAIIKKLSRKQDKHGIRSHRS